MDLINILRVLKQRLGMLIGIPLISVLCAIFFVTRLDEEYKSVAQIATGSMSDESVNLSDLKSGSFEVNSRITNIIESMNSIPVVSLVSYQLILHDLEGDTPFREMNMEDLYFEWNEEDKQEFIRIYKDRLANVRPLNTFEEEDNKLLTVLYSYRYDFGSLMENLTIKRQGASDFINVEYVSENPLLSAYLVNTLCKEYIRFNRISQADKSSESIGLLELILAQKKKTLDDITAALNAYKETNAIYNVSVESQQKIDQLAAYELNIEAEQKKISGLQLSLSTVEAKLRPLKIRSKDEVVQVNKNIIDLRNKINEAIANNEDTNTINQLREKLQLEMNRLAAMNTEDEQSEVKQLLKDHDIYSLELQIAKSNLMAMEQSLQKLKSDVSGFAGKEAGLAKLQLQVQLASEDYLNAQEKFNDAQNKALVGGTLIRQVIQGQPSKDPEPSNSILLVGLAGFGSLALVIMVLLGLEFVDFTIRTQEKFEILTGLKSMGAVNKINNRDLNLSKTFSMKNKVVELDRFVHSLRKLRFDIQNSNAKYFLITSTQDTVGKSFMIVCIAYTLSLTGKRILIIDTNFKNNTLTKLLIPRPESQKLLGRGLMAKTMLLLDEGKGHAHAETKGFTQPGDKEKDEPVNKSFIQNTMYPNVDIIGNQGGTESPIEILAGKDFNELLRKLGSQYDYILLEGAALNEYSDSKELMEFVEKIIPVFSAVSSLTNLDRESIKYLKSMESKLLGAILNNVKLKDLQV